MALARVVSFDGVNGERLAELVERIQSEDGPPADIPAKEMMILHDAGGEQALALVFFDSEDDYARGDAALNAMPTDETPGRRSSVSKYEVALRMTS